ncbi:MAG: hypothetical protein EOO74_06200 [Myxococcales bacterium]|nr:MAG: hypothetical protein EOO74_06200 [Myxococcales bacterium]
MAALTGPKKVWRLGEHLGDSPGALGAKAATINHKGGIVVNDAGVAAPGRTALNLIPMGVCWQTADNSSGAANAMSVEFETGDFRFEVLGADPVTAADIGNDVFIVDDQTIARTNGSGTRSRLGKLVKFDAEGAFVRVAPGL